MAVRSGIDAQLGCKAETTYGTYVAPDHFYEFNEFGIELGQDEMKSASLRVGNFVQRADRRENNRKGVSGSINLPFFRKGMGIWLDQCLGSDVISTPGGATLTRRQTITIADNFAKSMTIQGGVPDIGGTVRPFSWLGCIVTQLEFSQELDDFLMLAVEVDGQDETTAQALAAVSYPTANKIFHWQQGTITVGGSPFHSTGLGLTIPAGRKTDRYFIRADVKKKQPIPNAKREPTGSLSGEFEDLTVYGLFVAKTPTPIVMTWTGEDIEATFPYKLTITMPACVFTGTTPGVDGTDVVDTEFPFDILDDGTNPPITIVLDSTDATP